MKSKKDAKIKGVVIIDNPTTADINKFKKKWEETVKNLKEPKPTDMLMNTLAGQVKISISDDGLDSQEEMETLLVKCAENLQVVKEVRVTKRLYEEMNIDVKRIYQDTSYSNHASAPQRFFMERINDQTGVSRTGRVIEGVLFQTGQVVIQWRPPLTSIAIYPDFESFLKVHVLCHPSCNMIRWLDTPDSLTERQASICLHGKEPDVNDDPDPA